jgi:hypothetical protein
MEKVHSRPFQAWLSEEKLKQATFYYNRADNRSTKGKDSIAVKFYNKRTSLCTDGWSYRKL